MFFYFQLELGVQCFCPMHLRPGPVSLLLLLLPPLHHIKVPRGSKVSNVEVILSDKMSREPWSRDQRWMGGLWKWHRQHISWWPAGVSKPKLWKVQRDLVLVRPIHFPPFPLSIDRTSRFQLAFVLFVFMKPFSLATELLNCPCLDVLPDLSRPAEQQPPRLHRATVLHHTPPSKE